MAEAANIYEQFVASFETDTDSKTFVRGGSETAGRRDRDRDRGGRDGGRAGGFSSGPPGSEYKLDSRTRRGSSPPRERERERRPGSNFSSGPPKKPMTEMERLLEEMKESKEGGSGGRARSGSGSNFSSGPHSGEKGGSKKPKRAIDDFLEEIKTKQETVRIGWVCEGLLIECWCCTGGTRRGGASAVWWRWRKQSRQLHAKCDNARPDTSVRPIGWLVRGRRW